MVHRSESLYYLMMILCTLRFRNMSFMYFLINYARHGTV